MLKEYVFWFHVRRKIAYYFLWNMPKELVRVIIRDGQISSDGPIWMNSQDTLNISLLDIAEIKMVISATGQNGSVEIVTKESRDNLPKRYVLVPTNPFDPTLLSHSNVDEVKAFIQVIEALKDNRIPVVDENPYIRQFEKDKPAYLNDQVEFPWDKNVSPWTYYYEFVPASVDKKKHVKAKVYEIIMFCALSVMFLALLYAIHIQVVRYFHK